MKTPLANLTVCSTTLLLTLALALSLDAAPNDTTPPENADIVYLNDQPATATFRLAYDILAPGKHNYNGHRGRAMSRIQDAAKLMGVELAEKLPKADETQVKSDARLHLAQRLLEQLRPRLLAEDQKPVLEKVDLALMQIDKSLKIRAIEDEPAEPK